MRPHKGVFHRPVISRRPDGVLPDAVQNKLHPLPAGKAGPPRKHAAARQKTARRRFSPIAAAQNTFSAPPEAAFSSPERTSCAPQKPRQAPAAHGRVCLKGAFLLYRMHLFRLRLRNAPRRRNRRLHRTSPAQDDPAGRVGMPSLLKGNTGLQTGQEKHPRPGITKKQPSHDSKAGGRNPSPPLPAQFMPSSLFTAVSRKPTTKRPSGVTSVGKEDRGL